MKYRGNERRNFKLCKEHEDKDGRRAKYIKLNKKERAYAG